MFQSCSSYRLRTDWPTSH